LSNGYEVEEILEFDLKSAGVPPII
jgi:hypothetical protein